MKRIKFRGKNVRDGEWVYGDFLRICGGCIIYFGDETETLTPDIPNSSLIAVELFIDEVAVVIPDTIGQFTGIADRTGKEIYEGDIIEEHDLLYEVCWYDDIAAFMAEDIESEKPFLMSDMDLTKTRVIGNVHDNPDLLNASPDT